jgi:hypothetical protein
MNEWSSHGRGHWSSTTEYSSRGRRAFLSLPSPANSRSRVGDACQAFLRAFRRRPLLERARIRQEELARLEYLRTVVQSRSDLTAEHMQRRLRAIQGMRDAILAD